MMNLRSDFTNDHVPSGMKNGNTCRPVYPEFSPTHSYNGCVHETLHATHFNYQFRDCLILIYKQKTQIETLKAVI